MVSNVHRTRCLAIKRNEVQHQQARLTHCFALQACLACKGAILFTGIGKSGFIAQKVCQTLVSTGTKAVFLNPTDALHGDIGIVTREDLVVLVSKSGATDELLRLVPYARVRISPRGGCWSKMRGVTPSTAATSAETSTQNIERTLVLPGI